MGRGGRGVRAAGGGVQALGRRARAGRRARLPPAGAAGRGGRRHSGGGGGRRLPTGPTCPRGIQDRLVTPLSVPNVFAALAGQGGLTAGDRTLTHAALRWPRCARAPRSWRRERLLGAAGVAMLASVLTLGWTMPWYVWWVLPFAALARRGRSRSPAWRSRSGSPSARSRRCQSLMHDVGYRPTRTPVGLADHLYMERYLK